MKKLNSNNALAALSEDQLTQIYNWLHAGMSYDKAVDKVAQPPPDGFGLRVSVICLRRFYERRRADERAEDVAEHLPLAVVPRAADLYQQAAAEEFAHLAFEAAHSPPDPRSFAQLANWFAKHEYNQIQSQFLEVAQTQTRLARDRLTLATQQFQFNAARQVMKHLLELLRIHNLPDLDDEDKIWKASQLIFQTQTQTEK